jgi:hypothetical protein
MAPATVTHSTETRKPASRYYYAIFHDRHGVLGTLDGDILFLDDADQSLTTIEPPDFPWIAVLGNLGIADTQQIMDHMHGGYARIACSRAN